MLSKRIIPCLDVKDGRTVKGVHFEQLRDVGDAVDLGRHYALQGADELVYLDISASQEGRSTFTRLVERVADAIHIPLTVGGGISSLDDAARLLDAGADKVSINSAALARPELIDEIASRSPTATRRRRRTGRCVHTAAHDRHPTNSSPGHAKRNNAARERFSSLQ